MIMSWKAATERKSQLEKELASRGPHGTVEYRRITERIRWEWSDMCVLCDFLLCHHAGNEYWKILRQRIIDDTGIEPNRQDYEALRKWPQASQLKGI